MNCSLIITTYNWPEALELVLTTAVQQSVQPDEIVIADDGSTKDTEILVSKFSNKTSVILNSYLKRIKYFLRITVERENIKRLRR